MWNHNRKSTPSLEALRTLRESMSVVGKELAFQPAHAVSLSSSCRFCEILLGEDSTLESIALF